MRIFTTQETTSEHITLGPPYGEWRINLRRQQDTQSNASQPEVCTYVWLDK